MPLTLPRTRPEPPHDTQNSRTCGEHVLVPDVMSLVTVRYNDLRCSQAITATTPSLQGQLDSLSLTLEFFQVFSGRLSIAQVGDAASGSRKYQMIDIRDIPATELPLTCLDNSNEFKVQLQHRQKGIVCSTFAWFQRQVRSNKVRDRMGNDTGDSSPPSLECDRVVKKIRQSRK